MTKHQFANKDRMSNEQMTQTTPHRRWLPSVLVIDHSIIGP
ncbi:hypothetical protein [Wenzhouxiangella sp. EGI_FJ10305]